MAVVKLTRNKPLAKRPHFEVVGIVNRITGNSINVKVKSNKYKNGFVYPTFFQTKWTSGNGLEVGKKLKFYVTFDGKGMFIRTFFPTQEEMTDSWIIYGKLEDIKSNTEHDILTISGAYVYNLSREFEIDKNDEQFQETVGWRVSFGLTGKFLDNGKADLNDTYEAKDGKIKQKKYVVLALTEGEDEE